jgi:hypothetical protein
VIPQPRCNRAAPSRETLAGAGADAKQPIFNKRRESVAVFSNQPDSLRAGGVRCVANAANSVVTAFPDAQRPSRTPREGGIRLSMLPGFRFLFAAIVLTMSILVFGLGAAALLRAAHEEFASNPSWRAAPEAMFAQQSDATRPVLAMLRVEPAAAEQKAPNQAPAAVAPVEHAPDIAAPAEPAPVAAAPAETGQVAALKPEETSAPEAAKPEVAASESPAPSEAAPTQTEAPAAADTARITAPDAETKTASTEQVSPPAPNLSPANDAAPTTPEQKSTPASPEVDAAATKIATLGGPAVNIETPAAAKAVSDKPDRSAIKKRQQARRAAHRRRMAARARQAQLAPQRPAAEPFTQPLAQPPAAARR